MITKLSIFFLFVLFAHSTANAQFTQIGQKIDPVAINVDFGAEFGSSLSLSSNGKIAIIGAPHDKGDVGAAFIYTLTQCGWEVSEKLIGSNGLSGTLQGYSVDISADGNTAVIGAPKDNGWVGAAWIFAKTGSTWAQVKKIIPTDASGQAEFGASVAISADGGTVIIGGPGDNNGLGAAWIFRKSGNWAQTFSKMLGSDIRTSGAYPAHQGISVDISGDGGTAVVGAHNQDTRDGGVIIYTLLVGNYLETEFFAGAPGVMLGHSVAISANGSTIIAGAPRASGYQGGIVIFERQSGTWIVQADALLSGSAKSHQGMAVSIAADGNTAVVGGGGMAFTPFTIGQGQTWIITRSGSTWFEQPKYIGFPSSGNCQQGSAVALSGNGKSFLTSGFADNNYDGAAWFFSSENITLPPPPAINNFNPKIAYGGQTVTISGTNFDCVTNVSFGNIFGQILSKSSTTITAKVSLSGASGDLCVYAPSGKYCINGFIYSGSSTMSIDNHDMEKGISLFPNPVTDQLIVDFAKPTTENTMLVIYDYTGRKIVEKFVLKGEKNSFFDVSNLISGIYILSVCSESVIQNYKFVKN